jgi:hypothetical protein
MTTISSTSQAYPSDRLQIPFQQIKNDWQSLAKSLQSGDLTSAQDAFASLQQDQQTMGPPPGGENSQITSDFDALSSALKSGDLDGAQKAFSQLQTDMQAMRPSPGQRPGSHGKGGDSADVSADDSQSSSTKTVTNKVTQTNANGTVTITYTYADGSTSTVTEQAPVSSTSTLDASNSAQLQTLLAAQEDSQRA